MKKFLLLSLFSALSFAKLVEGVSPLSVEETSAKLQEILTKKGVKVFSVFNHSLEATNVNLTMNETQVVVFGSPKMGTPLMQCSPTLALELPLKFLIYKKDDKTIVAYEDLKKAAKRHDSKNCQDIIKKLSKAQENFFKAITN